MLCCCAEEKGETAEIKPPVSATAPAPGLSGDPIPVEVASEVAPEPIPAVAEPPPQAKPQEIPEPPAVVQAAPAKTEASPPSVQLVFANNGQSQTKLAMKKPLGLVFNQSVPMTVMDIRKNSHGEELGVQKGWILTEIGRENATTQAQSTMVMDVLARHLDPLPSDSRAVAMVFSVQGQKDKTVTISRRPLGLRFDAQIASTGGWAVSLVTTGSHGEKLGIQSGWILKTVGDVNLSTLDWDAANAYIQRTVSALPPCE